MNLRVTKLPMLVLVFTCLTGCATVDAKLPKIDPALLQAETLAQEKQAFDRYQQQLTRLDQISAQVLQANADLCPKTRPDFGVITHHLKSYPKKLRAAARRQLDAKEEPVVLYVRPNGAADKSGVTLGDRLISSAGKVLPAAKAEIGTKIGDTGRILSADPIESCGYNVRLKFSGAVNAYATGRTIIVTTGMMEFVNRNDELALIIGHELAHNTMDHVRKSIQNAILSVLAYRTIRPFESEADYFGVYYASRAGYDMNGVEDIWRRIGVRHPQAIVYEKSHPITPRRLLAIKAAVSEINDKRALGRPVLPNLKVQAEEE